MKPAFYFVYFGLHYCLYISTIKQQWLSKMNKWGSIFEFISFFSNVKVQNVHLILSFQGRIDFSITNTHLLLHLWEQFFAGSQFFQWSSAESELQESCKLLYHAFFHIFLKRDLNIQWHWGNTGSTIWENFPESTKIQFPDHCVMLNK